MANEDYANNFYLAKTFATTHPEIVAILRGHPLYPALSKKVTVPQTYLTQMWQTLQFIPETVSEPEYFYFNLISGETFRLRFDINVFRRAISFPLSNAYPDKHDFEPIPSDSTIIDTLNNLGYEGHFSKISEFKRNLFAKQWCILFMILNRCLTHSYSGIDSLTKSIAQILYGVAYHRHIDFAHIIWTNLIKITPKKTKYTKYTPYIRFLSIILNHFLTTNPEIPALTDDLPVLLSSMKYTRDNTGSNIAQPAPIPQALLILADRNDNAVMRYRELVARMEPEQPQAPAPRAHSQLGEGSSKKGSKRKSHAGKRIEGDLGEPAAKERRTKLDHNRRQDQQPVEPITEPIPQTPESESEPTGLSVPARTPPVSQDDDGNEELLDGKREQLELDDNVSPMSDCPGQQLPRKASTSQCSIICVQGYEVKESVAPILEAIFKKHGDIAAECVFTIASVRASLLEVVCEVVRRIQANDVIEKMEEIESHVSQAEAAKIDVSWLRVHLEAIYKRKDVMKKWSLLMETKVNTVLVQIAAQMDLRERCVELVTAQERFEEAERCVRVLHLVEKKLNNNILDSKAEKDRQSHV